MEMEIDREELKRTESSLLEVIKMFRICEDTKKKPLNCLFYRGGL